MSEPCTTYTEEQLGRYADNELSGQERKAVDEHCRHCPECRSRIKSYQAMTSLFTGHVDRQARTVNFEDSAARIQTGLSRDRAESSWFPTGLFGKNIYLKLASIVAIVGISLAAYQGQWFGGQWFGTGLPGSVAGPSAIIQSVDTDVSSVMIFETENSRHTIIWFSET